METLPYLRRGTVKAERSSNNNKKKERQREKKMNKGKRKTRS